MTKPLIDTITIFTINPSKRIISPAKLIDDKAGVVLQQLPLWHPALGYHSPIAIHNVKLQHYRDPARYTVTANPNDTSLTMWDQAEVGTTWLDTSLLGYLPYYDDQITPDVNDRLYSWGKLAPWSTVNVCQWVQSTVPPSQWDTTVIAQTNDTSIAQNDKVTGTPRLTTFRRVRPQYTVIFTPSSSTITSTGTFQDNDQVVFSVTSGNILPAVILPSVKYIVTGAPIPSTTFSVTDPDTGDIITFTSDIGTGTINIVPIFLASEWVKQSLLHDRVTTPFLIQNVQDLTSVGSITFPYTLPSVGPQSIIAWIPTEPMLWNIDVTPTALTDLVDIYVNGILLESSVPIAISGIYFVANITNPLIVNQQDIIDIVRPVHNLSASEVTYNPDTTDDGTTLIQWKQDFEYSSNTFTFGGFNQGSSTTTFFYFWVEQATTRNNLDQSSVSVFEAEQEIETIPTPYFVVQKPKDDPALIERFGYGIEPYGSAFSLGVLTDQAYEIPVLYRQAIIRKIASYITDDNRYFLRFIRDMTLRDDLQANGKQINLKDKHEEWFLFRREQTSNIPRELWDRLTEALIGYKLTDMTIRVPTLERELYDAIFGTDTQFGLGDQQAFVNSNLGLATVLSYLQNPVNDFTPIDIDTFFVTYSFDTPANIQIAMDAIYNTFNALHVNAIWFETLFDSLSTRAKYREIMKTSWVALHGVRILNIGGQFDD